MKKYPAKNLLLLVLSLILSMSPVSAQAVESTISSGDKVAQASNRLIVKLRPNDLPKGLSVKQINDSLRKPFTVQTLSRFQTESGVKLKELRALSNGAHVLSIHGAPDKLSINKAITAIGSLAEVEYVEEDRIMTIQAAANDTYYSNLWGMHPASAVTSPAPGGTGNYGADFETAWDTITGTGVVVAVVDTGITPHVDMVGFAGTVSPATGNLVSAGYDFISDCRIRNTCAATTSAASAVVAPSANASDLGDFISTADRNTPGSLFFGYTGSNSSWHGTHVSGTIAALGNNAFGVIGGAYSARILPVRVLGKGGGYTSDIVEGMKWAAGVGTIANPNPAKVINLSLGGSGACSITQQNAINAIVAAGVVVVVAAGNGNQDVANSSPANCSNVISVAAIGRDGRRAYYSNFSGTNKKVTLAAQGGDVRLIGFDHGILSSLNSGATSPDAAPAGSNYAYYQGTSMATPHVVAAVALMMARNPALTPAQIKSILSASSSLTPFPSFVTSLATWDCALTKNCGAGILNAKLAVQNSITPLIASSATLDFGSLPINDSANKTVTLTNFSSNPVTVGSVTVSGNDAALFNVAINTCNTAPIAPSGTCQITVNYAPTVQGTHSAALSVSTTAPVSTTVVGLIGIAGSSLTTTTPLVTAATVNAGQSTTVNISFSNPNSSAVRTGVIALSRQTIMATSTDNCSNVMLAAGSSCGVIVTITPTAAGAYSGDSLLGLSGGGAPAVATISGTANAAPPPAAAGGGGGGCSVMPASAKPDASLLLAILLIWAYCFCRTRFRGAARL